MNLEAAKALAYTYLSRRERTSREMREHLLARGVDERVAIAVLAELTNEGYLDDQRFARLFTQDKRALSGWGAGRIRRALITRGIAEELVDSALQDGRGSADARDGDNDLDRDGRALNADNGALNADAGADELTRALTVLRRRFPSPPATNRDRRRALGVLMRKGYEYELAVDALAEHVRQAGDAIASPSPRY